MITQNEFLDIIEKHLSIRSDGSIYIKDPKVAKAYSEYIKQFATKEEPTKGINLISCHDDSCPVDVKCTDTSCSPDRSCNTDSGCNTDSSCHTDSSCSIKPNPNCSTA